MCCNDISYVLKESEPRFICFRVPSKILHHNFYLVFICDFICDKLLLCNMLSRGLNITLKINTSPGGVKVSLINQFITLVNKIYFHESNDKHFFYQNRFLKK